MATIYKRLKNYVTTPGVFRATFTGVSTSFHPYINSEEYRSLLFKDLFDYSKRTPVKIADWFWMNDNIPWQKTQLEAGDYVQFQAEGDKHRIGSEGHPFNTIRYINTIYRLKRPYNIIKLGKVEGNVSPLQLPVIDLESGGEYNTFEEYCKGLKYFITDREKEKRLVMLIESINYIPLWLNLSKTKYIRVHKLPRPYYPLELKGKKLRYSHIWTYKTYSNVKPLLMFKSVFDSATPEQQKVLLNRIEDNTPVDKIDTLLDKLDKLELRPL